MVEDKQVYNEHVLNMKEAIKTLIVDLKQFIRVNAPIVGGLNIPLDRHLNRMHQDANDLADFLEIN